MQQNTHTRQASYTASTFQNSKNDKLSEVVWSAPVFPPFSPKPLLKTRLFDGFSDFSGEISSDSHLTLPLWARRCLFNESPIHLAGKPHQIRRMAK